MPHSPTAVFGQWRFLEPYAFGDPQPDGSVRQATFEGFKRRYVIMGGFLGREVLGYRNLDEMQTIMAKNAAVARKEDALDLPRDQDTVVHVNLSPAEKKAYAEMKGQLAAMLAPGVQATVPNKLAQLMRLRQITAGHVPDDQGIVRTIGNSKVATISSIAHDTLAGEKRIVVFASFTHEINELCRSLERSGTEVLRITGGTPGADRIAIRKRFGSDDPARLILVAQIKTISLAVNELVTASNAIFASLSQQRDDIVQARDRLNRIGQTKPTTFWFANAPGTVDDIIYQSYVDRSNLEAAMLKHVMEQG
jgi:SNF2 family DNA or RNA helicase